MTSKIRRQLSVLGRFRWLRLASLLAALVLVTLPLISNTFTDAKFIAAASADASARVAKWYVRMESDDVPAEKTATPDIPYDGTKEKEHPLLLLFKGAQGEPEAPELLEEDAEFVLTFINDSEVSARFTPTYTVEAGSIDGFIFFHKGTSSDPVIPLTGANAGLAMAPLSQQIVTVVIKSTTNTFAELKIRVQCEQIN